MKINRSPTHKYISISFKTESRGYAVKKNPTNDKKADKSGHSWSESPSKKVDKPKKLHIKHLKICSIAFSFREKKRGADRSASLLYCRDPGYTERFATPNRPKQAQATETANRMFSGYIVNRPMTDLHTESKVVTIAVSKVGAVSAAAMIVKPGICFSFLIDNTEYIRLCSGFSYL